MSDLPKHPDGRNKKIGEMTSAERRMVFAESVERVKAGLERPEMQAALARTLSDGIGRA